MEIAQRMGDRSGQAGAATNIGHILMQQGDLSGARHQIDQATALANKIGERNILGEATNT